MLEWDDVRVFLALHRCGSHARAAKKLGVDPTTVGRRVAALEQVLQAKLFDRTPAGVAVTAAGAALAARADRAEAEMIAAEREARGSDARLEGPVVVTAGDAVTTYLLAPRVAELRREHPGIVVELSADNRSLDVARLEADVAVRLFKPREPALVASRAGRLPFGLFGSDEYFARRGRPRSAEDLAAHDWIGWDRALASTTQEKWLARHAPRSRVVLRANTTTALVAACAAGVGLAALPTFVGRAEARLAPVLPRTTPPPRDVWLVTHPDARGSARVRAVVAWLGDIFAASRRSF
jgi:DNA-binding transcriptional LysR family regulator